MFELDGRTALVTGASRGIGAACARALDDAGARVALAARSVGDLEKVASDLSNDPVVLEADVSDAAVVAELVPRAVGALGRLDVLVNNAGISMTVPTGSLSTEQLDQIHAVNLRSVIQLSAAAADVMAGAGGGSIVQMSSLAGSVGSSMMTAYAATKGAVDAATRAMAAEWGPQGVRVNSVAPGVIATEMWEAGRSIPGAIEAIEKLVALRRWGTPEDVADVVLFLASDASRYISGQTICVDGGVNGVNDVVALLGELLSG